MKRTIFFFVTTAFLLTSYTQAQTFSLSGQIMTSAGTPLGQLEINLLDSDDELIETYFIDCNGIYTIEELTAGVEYQLEIVKNDTDPLNGTSTFDLVLISKHILGVAQLNSYAELAGDVNNDEYLSISDLMMIRALILNIEIEIPENLGKWIFFKEGSLQADDSFTVQINEDTTDYNFIAITKGDINSSAISCD